MRDVRQPLRQMLTVLLLVGSLTGSAQGQTIYVNHTNNTCDMADGTKQRPYRTVTEAVAKAPPGSRLEVHTGVYNENVTIPQHLMLTTSGGAVRIGYNSTLKVCQLTGEVDLERCKQTTRSQTKTQAWVQGTDLGIPVEHNNSLFFLFGDTIPNDINHTEDRPPAGDSIALVKLPADPEQCLQLEFIRASDGGYLSPKVRNPYSGKHISLGGLEVPTGGFSAKDSTGGEKMYVFFTTDYVKRGEVEIMRRSVLARWDNAGQNLFTYLYDVSCRDLSSDVCSKQPVGKFINVAPVVVNNADIPGLPDLPGQGVLLWGSGLYRRSNPYLAYLPLNKDGNPGELFYWREDQNTAQKSWVRNAEEGATELFDQPCIGELSVTWNSFLRKWLMLYNCGNARGIHYRVADKPWGPWSPAALLFDPSADGGDCHFMHQPGCDPVYERENDESGEYGPYVISHFTTGDATTTSIYWTMSTMNPYQVVLMKSTLRLSDAQRAD